MIERLHNLIDDIKENRGGPPMEWRTAFILLVTPVLLTLYYYFGRPAFFNNNLTEWATQTFGGDWAHMELASYGYWALAGVVLRVLLPLVLIVAVLRQSPREYGYRLRGSLRHVPVYALLFVAVLPLIYLASTQSNFQDRYPFYRQAVQGGWRFWVYESFYFVQFFALEAFFRGFLVFGLFRRFGYYSVLIQVIPYCMVHFNKPFAETMSAIAAGVILGVLALRSGTFYIGVLLHFAVALAMDLLALG